MAPSPVLSRLAGAEGHPPSAPTLFTGHHAGFQADVAGAAGSETRTSARPASWYISPVSGQRHLSATSATSRDPARPTQPILRAGIPATSA